MHMVLLYHTSVRLPCFRSMYKSILVDLCNFTFLVLEFANTTVSSSPVCFLCDNSDCILPTKTQNVTMDEHWWLCDEYPHCLDHTDEDKGQIDTYSASLEFLTVYSLFLTYSEFFQSVICFTYNIT